MKRLLILSLLLIGFVQSQRPGMMSMMSSMSRQEAPPTTSPIFLVPPPATNPVIPIPPLTPTCVDNKSWKDSNGAGCSAYKGCTDVEKFAVEGVSAKHACCICRPSEPEEPKGKGPPPPEDEDSTPKEEEFDEPDDEGPKGKGAGVPPPPPPAARAKSNFMQGNTSLVIGLTILAVSLISIITYVVFKIMKKEPNPHADYGTQFSLLESADKEKNQDQIGNQGSQTL